MNKQGKATITASFDIHGIEELNNLMAKLRQIDGVLDIEEPQADKNLDNSAFRCVVRRECGDKKVCRRYYGRQVFFTHECLKTTAEKLYRHKASTSLLCC